MRFSSFHFSCYYGQVTHREGNLKMEQNCVSLGRRAIRQWLRLLFLFALLPIAVFSPFAWLVHAEGSVNITANGGDRPWFDGQVDTLGGISRTNIIKVYANAG